MAGAPAATPPGPARSAAPEPGRAATPGPARAPSTDRELIVIGGGPAGLGAALEALDAGLDVEILEAGERLGGYLATDHVGGYALARGPHSLSGAPRSLAFAERLDVPLRRAAAPPRRYLLKDGRLLALPGGPLSFAASPLLSLRGKLRLLAEPFASAREAADDDTVARFFRRRLGAEAADRLVGPLVGGIHAGDPDRLEARSAFPRAFAAEKRSGSLLRGFLAARREGAERGRPGTWSPEGGLGPLGDAAARVLGSRARTGAAVVRLERRGSDWCVETATDRRTARSVIVALPPHRAAPLLAPLDDEIGEVVGGIDAAAVALVHLGGTRPGDAPEGFGALVPRDEGLSTLGLLFSSSLFPDRAPASRWLSASFLGGAFGGGLLERSNDEIVRLAADEAERIVGFRPGDELAVVHRHPRAIPQLTVGHATRMARVRERMDALPGLSLAGGWIEGVGVENALRSGRRAVRART